MKPHSFPATPGWYGNEGAVFEQFASFWPWQQQQQQRQQPQFNAAGGLLDYRGLQPTHTPLLPPPLQQFIGWPQWVNRPLTSGNNHWGANSSQPLTSATLAATAVPPQPVEQAEEELDTLSTMTATTAPATTTVADGAESGGLRLTSKLEEATQKALFRIFRKPFIKARLPWLVNPLTKKQLEFDLWSESLRVAVEVDEAHHFVRVNKRHSSELDFEYQRYRDAVKEILARKHAAVLIRVPFSVSKNDVEEYLREQLRQARVPMPPISPASLSPRRPVRGEKKDG